MELIKGLTQEIKASFPTAASDFSAQVYNEDGTVNGAVLVPVVVENQPVKITVPHSVVTEEGKYKLAVGYKVDDEQYTRNIYFHVATPYLDYWELREILSEEEGFDEAEVWQVEAAARYMINVYCGQEFGYAHKTVTFRGEDGIALDLPQRLIKLEAVSENGAVKFDLENDIGLGNFITTGSGWFLKRGAFADWDTWGSLDDDVIVAPPKYSRGYKNDVEYTVTGIFGYEEVPGAVKEAMKLLVNDYACAEQLYRDRFLESMKAADWRLQFNSGAYYKTGNARANLLLAPYVVNRMKVI
jgi:hypothetical protein